jgi:hypothetical protein
MSVEIEVINVCSVRGVLAGGRAICGNVGCGEPWKCWSDEPCDKQIKPAAENLSTERKEPKP